MLGDSRDESFGEIILQKKSKSNLDLLNNENIIPKITLNNRTKTPEDSK